MALLYECTTELDAVNSMLEIVGEMPVNDLSDTEVSAAYLAHRTLHRFSRKIQSEGLNCNTEVEYRGTPNGSGNIALPTNTLNILNVQHSNPVIMKNGMLYDMTDHTFVFSYTVLFDLVQFLEYETLPQHVREYVMMSAARRFLSNTVGAKELLEQTNYDFGEAKREFVRWELKTGDNNFLTSPATANIVFRRTI